MPPGAFRAGPPSGQYDADGRRAAAPRFDSQPVQGVSSIKPGPTAGAWWALSDNGFGRKWNSSDYRLCVYLFDVRPRTEAGTDSRTALQARGRVVRPREVLPVAAHRRERSRAAADRRRRRSRIAGRHAGRHLLARRRDRALAAAFLGGRRLARGRRWNCPTTCARPIIRWCWRGADRPNLARSRGFEAMDLAGDDKTLVTILEGAVTGDPPQTAARAALRHHARASGCPALLYMSWMRTPCR